MDDDASYVCVCATQHYWKKSKNLRKRPFTKKYVAQQQQADYRAFFKFFAYFSNKCV